ncbi:sulfotransferase 1C2-like [Mytilus californianus]|uniref:sulfotransferase 1C2-like n=1 Tax=Mytilus californianus TaxID=6549 RepID=UPI002246E08C|nr:sulfotransferase 1C2-like [Mytilus californianus]
MPVLEPVPLPEYDGVTYISLRAFREKGPEQTIKDVKDFHSRETDIIICTYLKAGVHWLDEIIAMLVNRTTTLASGTKGQRTLEGIPELSVLDSLPSPRILNTHLSFKYIPTKHVQNKGKIVHMIRNPKDICVSLYHHAKKDVVMNYDVPWDTYFENWMSGKVFYGSWYDYELGMEEASIQHPGMIYTCYYEDFKREPRNQIRKLADFLDINVSDQILESITEETSFENMKSKKTDNTKFVNMKEAEGFIYRKGDIGDWKTHFTVNQNSRFDTQFKDRMKDSKYNITFE